MIPVHAPAAMSQVKASADTLEERELAAAVAALRARQQLDQSKLLTRQARELDALRNRLRALRDERILSQERELQKLMNKIKVRELVCLCLVTAKQHHECLNSSLPAGSTAGLGKSTCCRTASS